MFSFLNKRWNLHSGWKNSRHTRQHGTSSSCWFASLVTRDCGIVSHSSARFLLHLSQGGCVGHSSLYRWSDPHISVWASIITKIVKIWDCHSLQNLIPICYRIVMASLPMVNMLPHTWVLPTKYCYLMNATLANHSPCTLYSQLVLKIRC